MAEEQLLQGSCHCGAVRLTLPSVPEKATKCNCSICRRLGGLWAYYECATAAGPDVRETAGWRLTACQTVTLPVQTEE